MLKIDKPIWVLFWVFLLGGAMHEAVSAEPPHSATPAASGGERQPELNSVQVLEFVGALEAAGAHECERHDAPRQSESGRRAGVAAGALW